MYGSNWLRDFPLIEFPLNMPFSFTPSIFQAAARCWRDGQKKRCFTYRFLTAGTVEEKIFQRQLSKEGLQSVVDDKEQVNALSTKDLRNLFKLRQGTPSDTHDKLRCERCEIIHDNAEMEAIKVLPKKLAECKKLLEKMQAEDDAKHFLKVLDATEHGKTKEEYEKIVKQPMDFGTITTILAKPQDQPSAYKTVSTFSKDVNRVFANVLKVWNPGDEIADAARRLQGWWVYEWKELVPRLMCMKADDVECSVLQPSEADGVGDDGNGANMVKASAYVNNERGEDYQEQIGMPDEENMRHWSHHYSTDTVDDPVFRAAMRGYDSVSFVFGLEVTWSLIQERQQEEEERVAMEALQCIKEEGDEEDGDEAGKEPGDEDCKKPTVVEAKEDEPSVVPAENEDNESSGDSSSDDGMIVNSTNTEEIDIDVEESEQEKAEVDVELAKSSSDSELGADVKAENECDESSLQQEDEEADVTDAASPPGPLDGQSVDDYEEEDGNSSSAVGLDSPSGKENENNMPQEAQPPQKVAGPNQWQCTSCTFLNTKSSLRKCTMCHAKKPPSSSSSNKGKKRCIQELS
jgi:Bromodomain